MKRFSFLALVCAVMLAAVPAFAATELSVFAAASMTESMNQIAQLYQKVDPNVKIVYNFDSSGTLRTQIQQGAECDIFISAGQKQMNDINDAFVMPGTRFNIVANQVVLIVPKGKNATGIKDFADVATDKVKLIALGNSDVPVGQYSEEIFKNMKLWDKLNADNKITFASNVKEVLAQTAAAAVNCGVVYSTDAATSDAVEIVASAPQGTHKPIVYPAAIMKNTKNKAAAEAFVKYLKGDECSAIFKKIGFAIPEK
ncbi:MAG: molybdate ABC transporter substrate-binding protein [Synergistaceae bacterium]|nr:molybdate ABC transporter substrate-binding protein [Synergistaceae bacterium]